MNKVKVEYDKPIEVTRLKYNELRSKLGGVIVHRVDEEGRCWVKIWDMRMKKYVENIINRN